jgi:hypothetical protein
VAGQVTGEYLVANEMSTYACSESQKIGHVSFFWNGNRAAPFDPKLETFHEVSPHADSLYLARVLREVCMHRVYEGCMYVCTCAPVSTRQ